MAPPGPVGGCVVIAVPWFALQVGGDLHAERAELFRTLESRDYPTPSTLTGTELQQYLVLRGGVLSEQGTVDWLDEVLAALEPASTSPSPVSAD